MSKELLKEELNKFNQIIGYNPSKGLIKEETLLTEGLFRFFKKFSNKKEDVKDELASKLGIEDGDTKEDIKEKLKSKFGDADESKFKMIAKNTGGTLGEFLLLIVSIYLTYKAVIASPLSNEGSIIEFLAYGIASYLSWTLMDSIENKQEDET